MYLLASCGRGGMVVDGRKVGGRKVGVVTSVGRKVGGRYRCMVQ